MQVTFLDHSGFLIEMQQVTLLFDWWKGPLPPLPDKPLLVFASHSHEDHFKPEIFALDDGTHTVRFLLGNDIKLSRRHCEQWGLTEEILSHCQRLCGGKQVSPLPGITVETLPSTDVGVAFLVSCEGATIYHAGDLNWWHWDGEPDPWNLNMAHDYKRFLAPLAGRVIDLAMLPLDPRLDAAADWGPAYFLGLTQTHDALPMHQWNDFTATDRFLAKYPQWSHILHPISTAGQQITISTVHADSMDYHT